MKTHEFILRPLPPVPAIEAVQITEENIHEVADWCGKQVYKVFEGNVIRFAWPHSWETDDAGVGRWVIRESDGTFRHMSDLNFCLTYMSLNGRRK